MPPLAAEAPRRQTGVSDSAEAAEVEAGGCIRLVPESVEVQHQEANQHRAEDQHTSLVVHGLASAAVVQMMEEDIDLAREQEELVAVLGREKQVQQV